MSDSYKAIASINYDGSGSSPRSPVSSDIPLEEQEKPASTWQSDCKALKAMLFTGLNTFLIFIPFGLVSKQMEWNSAVVFTTNFLAIIPLAAILGTATESLADVLGQTLGGLINASFGNAVEIIITIDAIKKGLCKVVQAGLIGSVLSNLLLVMGMSFIASGALRKEQVFNKDGAGATTSCLLVAAIGLTIPTLFELGEGQREDDAVILSRILAVIMAVVYGFFLYFQLSTHTHHFEDVSTPRGQLMEEVNDSGYVIKRFSVHVMGLMEEDDEVALSMGMSSFVLAGATVIIAYLSELMVGSIESVSEDFGVPKAFIGLILLPIVGNAAEHMTAVVSAFKGKMDLAIGVAVGSSTQIALLVVPFSVMTGWYYDQPMDLNFGAFFSGTFLLTVFLVASVLGDGSSNWLEGLMLCATYLMIAVISWFMDGSQYEATPSMH